MKNKLESHEDMYENVIVALFWWFVKYRDTDIPISGTTFKKNAVIFHKEFN